MDAIHALYVNRVSDIYYALFMRTISRDEKSY